MTSIYKHFGYCAFIAVSLGACVASPEDDLDEPVLGEAQATVLVDRDLRLRKIRVLDRNESGDEIYLTATNGTSTNIIRPADPDYWLFEAEGQVHTMNRHVATVQTNGIVVTVSLWEQDNATLGDPHDRIGRIDIAQIATGPEFFDTSSARYLGIDADGRRVVEFTSGGRYRAYFDL